MKKAAQPTKIASTQSFTEIVDIRDDVVLQKGGNACIVIQVNSVNFSLLSKEEQNSRVGAYASLLNSLSFPMQIMVRSKRIHVLNYLGLLQKEASKTSNQKLSADIANYKDFVQSLLTTTVILDKEFYIVIPYSPLEAGVRGLVKTNTTKVTSDGYIAAKSALETKAAGIIGQLDRLSLKGKILEKDMLTALFHDIYNPTAALVKTPSDHLRHDLADIIAPPSVEVDFKTIRVGEHVCRTYFVAGYPRYVSTGWLEPLIDFDHSLFISMFVYPVDIEDVLSNLKRKIAEMEATVAVAQEKGLAPNPKVTAALSDALALQEELAKGMERFFQFGLYITVIAENEKELDETGKKLQSMLASLLVMPKPATLQMEEGFKTTLPMGQDKLQINRNMDTSSLASTFPFTSATLTQDKGILYGVNQQNGSLVIFDRYSLENANEVVFGKSGSGKSFAIKLEIMRQFMFGTEVIVIDPEREYDRLALALGGEHVDFSPHAPVKLNPFDLSGVVEVGENELGTKILSLRGLLKIMLGEIDASLDAVLDKALVETYKQKGITQDPKTQTNAPPLMEDLYKILVSMQEEKARELALRLEKYITGSLSGLFNQQSNFHINNPLTIFSIRDVADEVRPIAMHIILDYVWTRIRKTLKKRLLIVDEAWYLMRYEDSASFIYSIAKRARKYYLGLTTATQDTQDFLSTDYGKAVLTNSSIQILLKESPAEIDTIARTFYLSEGEKQLLLSANVGEGLFFAGQNHVAIQIVAAPFEYDLITSNPEDRKKAEEISPQSVT